MKKWTAISGTEIMVEDLNKVITDVYDASCPVKTFTLSRDVT